ncbi:MAG: hypothetical protein WBL61_06825 [Bryobacteraceae bacterium]
MSGLISQSCHPLFAEDLLSFQLFSLYSLISLRYLKKEPDIHSHPAPRRPGAEIYVRAKKAKEANKADSKGFSSRIKFAQIAKKGLGSRGRAETVNRPHTDQEE